MSPLEFITYQLKAALAGVSPEAMRRVVIAYEPIWAIGTGNTATPEQAGEVCAAIRGVLRKLYGAWIARSTTIQYGGSMNETNAEALLHQEDVDGGLIGTAALDPENSSKSFRPPTKTDKTLARSSGSGQRGKGFMKTPTTLIIMDGFALGEEIPGNAVLAAATPQLDYLFSQYPFCQLEASGLDVGLPDGQMGKQRGGTHQHRCRPRGVPGPAQNQPRH